MENNRISDEAGTLLITKLAENKKITKLNLSKNMLAL
jgi:hypothetical protein